MCGLAGNPRLKSCREARLCYTSIYQRTTANPRGVRARYTRAAEKYQKFRKSERTRKLSVEAVKSKCTYTREGDLKVKPFVRLCPSRDRSREKRAKISYIRGPSFG